MLQVVVCDDNDKILDRLCKMLESISIKNNIDTNICLKTTSAEEVLEFSKKNIANVFILDIDLKTDFSGIELAKKIRDSNKNAYIIFSTGHLEYVLMAYKVKTFDYLPKPITGEKLEETLLRLVNDMEEDSKKYIHINNVILDKNEINFIHRNGMKLVFSTPHKDYEVYTSFNKLENCLSENFVRCHKSYIVNVDKIKNVETNKNLISFENNDTCFIGPKYKNNFMEVFNYGNSTKDMVDTYDTKLGIK